MNITITPTEFMPTTEKVIYPSDSLLTKFYKILHNADGYLTRNTFIRERRHTFLAIMEINSTYGIDYFDTILPVGRLKDRKYG